MSGLLDVLEANRPQLVRYLRAQGMGEDAEDILQDLRLKLLDAAPGPVGNPLGYLYRALTNMVIDKRRADIQRRKRDEQWADSADLASDVTSAPGQERQLDSERALGRVEEALSGLTPRARDILLRHRVDGQTQRAIAADLGISQSTVESDLRGAYLLLHDLRKRLDEE